MIEDMLTYEAGTSLSRTFGELLAADLEDDARACYERTAADIAVVAAGADHSLASTAMRTLVGALAAAPTLRPGSWRRLHREVSRLVSGSDIDAVPGAVRPEFIRALGRLRQFVAENADLRDVLVSDVFQLRSCEYAGA